MAFYTFKCNHLMPLQFQALKMKKTLFCHLVHSCCVICLLTIYYCNWSSCL